jgi:ABC-type glycerol-3-phosphate transport system permease component
MTTSTQRVRAISDAGPVSRSYRRFLGKASFTMLALIILSAYLLPLLYMAMTAFQQPGQSSTPGAPVYPAKPLTGVYQGRRVPAAYQSRTSGSGH